MDLHDVDVGDDDEDRVDRLVDTTSFDTKQAEAIVRFAKTDESRRDPDAIPNYVSNGDAAHTSDGPYVEDGLTPDDCERLRLAMQRADRPTTVIDANPNKHPSVIFRHATGDCSHDVDVDATTSPRIKRDECREMRVDFQTGDTVEDIRSTYNRSANAVTRHVFGRCDHEFEHKYHGKELPAATCAGLRRAYRENVHTTEDDVARAFIIDQSTASRHLRGKCKHDDVGEDPIDTGGPAVPPTLCKAIRHEYRTRGVESVASVIDRLGVSSRGLFHYHLQGKCAHDVDVAPIDASDD